MSKKTIFLIVGILIIGVLAGYWYWTTTPQYSLNQVRSAITEHDVVKFKKYVDIEGVSSRLIDDALKAATEETQSGSSAEDFGKALGQGFVQLMKPRLTEMAEEQIIRYVEKGEINASEQKKESKANLNNITNDIGLDNKLLRGVDYVREEGSTAYVGLNFNHAEFDTLLTLEILMRDKGNYWQVAEISNVSELINEVDKIEEEKLSSINEPTSNKISDLITVTSIRKKNVTERFSRDVKFTIDFENKSDTPITNFVAQVDVNDSDGKLVKSLLVESNEIIKPKNEKQLSWMADINRFKSSDNRLYELEADQMHIDFSFQKILTENDTLRIFKNYSDYKKTL